MGDTKVANIISLGSFCSVAQELERMGLRSHSSPFDWLITKQLKTVLALIEHHFEGFLDEAELLQSSIYRNVYKNTTTKIEFYHDFNKYKSLHAQMDAVREKYSRRIERFYADIQKPTLFIRYIADRNDFEYIRRSYPDIVRLLKRYHNKNQILFVANADLKTETDFLVYYVETDEKDTVARRFIEKNDHLQSYLLSGIYDEDARKQNLAFYEKKNRENQKKQFAVFLLDKVKTFFVKPYVQNPTPGLYQKILVRFNDGIRKKKITPNYRGAVATDDFSILCNNCRAGTLLHDLGKPFHTPTINLFIKNTDFVNILEKMPDIFASELTEADEGLDYPVGELCGNQIHFNHSKTFEEAKRDWDRRVGRIHYENLFIVMTQLKGCKYDDLVRFDKLPYPKVVFTARKYPEIKSSIYIPGYEAQGYLEYLGGYKKLTQLGYREDEKYFDFVSWINQTMADARTDKELNHEH